MSEKLCDFCGHYLFFCGGVHESKGMQDVAFGKSTCDVRDHCLCTLSADRKTVNCCQCTTAAVYGEPFQFQPICRYSNKSEFDRLKEQKEELLQREREAFERPLLAEIDTLRLRVKILEEALWKIAHWREFARDTALYGPALDMRAFAGDALERAAIGERSE